MDYFGKVEPPQATPCAPAQDIAGYCSIAKKAAQGVVSGTAVPGFDAQARAAL